MAKLIFIACLQTKVNRKTQSIADIDMRIGEPVIVFRDWLEQLVGLYRDTDISGNIFHVHREGRLVQYPTFFCNPYFVKDKNEAVKTVEKNVAASARRFDRRGSS